MHLALRGFGVDCHYNLSQLLPATVIYAPAQSLTVEGLGDMIKV